MKISYNWLKEFIDLEKISIEEIVNTLEQLGFEISEKRIIEPVTKNIVISKIIDIKKHPQASKLFLCKVTDGKRDYSIVCGANNIKNNDIVPMALPGAVFGDKKIQKTRIRGIESEGMLCSEKELGLGDDHSGILVFPEETNIGENLSDIFKKDVIFNIDVPANRGDCLSHLGIARELSAKLKIDLVIPEIFDYNISEQNDDFLLKIDIYPEDLCPKYTGVIIKNIKIKKSPLFIQYRLKLCGLRPINNVVDITNYVMLELGHPLHAFDYKKIDKNHLIIRLAKENEEFIALDTKKYYLANDMLVIADENKPIALAGIIGGENSSVNYNTEVIVLESAVFKPENIRKTAKSMNIINESSFRFEKGSSYEICELSSKRAIRMILEYCEGIFVRYYNVEKKISKPQRIFLSIDYLNKILNKNFTITEIKNIFSYSNFKLQETQNKIEIEVPLYRNDIKENIDIIEEIARLDGYEKIPLINKAYVPQQIIQEPLWNTEKKLRKFLCGTGITETLNYSLVSLEILNRLKLNKNVIKIENPVSKEWEFLRPSILPGLFNNIVYNFNMTQSKNMRFFEIGKVFYKDMNQNYKEKDICGIILTGNIIKPHWKDNSSVIDFYYISGLLEQLLKIIGCNEFSISEPDENLKFFIKEFSSSISKNDNIYLANFGLIDPEIYIDDFPQYIYYAELYIENIISFSDTNKLFIPYSKFPSVKRDLSFVVSEDINYKTIKDKILSCQDENIKIEIQLFDLYRNQEKIGKDKKSLSLTFLFSNFERTLTDQEINKKIDEILTSLSSLGIQLRTK